jgi:hypothetical protein
MIELKYTGLGDAVCKSDRRCVASMQHVGLVHVALSACFDVIARNCNAKCSKVAQEQGTAVLFAALISAPSVGLEQLHVCTDVSGFCHFNALKTTKL